MVVTPFNLYKTICCVKYAHHSGPKGSPDMILNAFDMKFYNKSEGMPPRACRPSNKNPKNTKNASERGCPDRPSGGSGAAAPQEKKQSVSNLSGAMLKVSGLGQAGNGQPPYERVGKFDCDNAIEMNMHGRSEAADLQNMFVTGLPTKLQ